ncbi:ComF family protein [Deltaproteobacteria bacterium TL4]
MNMLRGNMPLEEIDNPFFVRWPRRISHQLCPPVCWICNHIIPAQQTRELSFPFLCSSCYHTLPSTDQSTSCIRCANLTPGAPHLGCYFCLGQDWKLEQTWSSFYYEQVIREWVLQLKFGGKSYLAPMMGYFLSLKIRSLLKTKTFDTVIPIPLHASRLRQRGFNQASLLAHNLIKNLPSTEKLFMGHGLQRVRKTSPQAELPEQERKTNIRQAFRVSSPVQGTRVLLVDDVMTTGSTLHEAARTLLDAGAHSVSAVVFARRLRGENFYNQSV